MVIEPARPGTDDTTMLRLSPGADRRRPLLPILTASFSGTTLVVAGLALAYVAYATPLVMDLLPTGRPSVGESLFGVAAWAVALIAPAGLLLLGANRLASMLAALKGSHGHNAAKRRAAALPDGVVAARSVDIGDGRPIPEVLVGPFGAVVLRDLPPRSATRSIGSAWEVFTSEGWLRIDSPLDATTRDAERLRRWFAHDDHDFVVKVHAAVIDHDLGVERTAGCAVVAEGQLVAWLNALPIQRSLTESRRARVLALLRGEGTRS